MSDLLTMSEVAGRTRLPLSTLRHWRLTGDGPKSFSLGRRVVYRAADVDAWLLAQYDAAGRAA